MITCTVHNGLGNALFPIATAYQLAKDNNDTVVLAEITNPTPAKGCFSVPGVTGYNDMFDPPIPICKNIPFDTFHFCREETKFKYSKISYQGNIYLSGSFQHPSYFSKEVCDEIFSISPKFFKYLSKKYPFLGKEKITAVHIRRGDYVSSQEFHPVLGADYYRSALQVMQYKTDRFVVFSDDIQWCQKHLKGENLFFISGEHDYTDFAFMTCCNNLIIANSTFSWWAAYLAKNEKKTVIAPQVWLGPKLSSYDTSEIYLPDWIVL